jgi:uncharacterized protein (TIGR02996 family)
MTSHPDADEFMRVYLRNPTDATTRLVFADWLEETGDPSNTAWAHFIRAKVATDAQRPGSPERREWDTEAGKFAPFIRANLTIPATLFVGYPKSLLQLLPGPNITVKLAGFQAPYALVELIPESAARENLVLSLDLQGRALLVAAAEPWNCDLVDKLRFILNRDIIAVRAELDDIGAAIDAAYSQDINFEFELIPEPRIELIRVFDDPAYHEPGPRTVRDGLAVDAPVNQLVGLLLVETRQRVADRVTISPINGAGYRFRVDGEWTERGWLPDRVLFPIAARLARMADAEGQFANTGGANGEFRCNVADNPLTVRVAIEPLEEGPVIQIDFLEERAIERR